jgi:AcrR family transcriptional regulator
VRQPIKKRGTGLLATAEQKVAFIEALQKNGGNVSGALRESKLNRATAYRHFKEDGEFSEAWLEALEVSNDSLFTEARRRAVEGVDEPLFYNGKEIGSVRKYSDTLLIFLLKQSEAQKKWRNRIVQTGNIALTVIRERGAIIGLSEEQIEDLQLAMTERFTTVPLV